MIQVSKQKAAYIEMQRSPQDIPTAICAYKAFELGSVQRHKVLFSTGVCSAAHGSPPIAHNISYHLAHIGLLAKRLTTSSLTD